jgi:transglutaminase-like putative cysteine protease
LRFEGGSQGSRGDRTKAPVHPYYCPIKNSWQGYPLPYGPGDYVLYAAPFNKDDMGTGKRQRFTFEFTAQFAEAEPCKYQSLATPYSNISTAVVQARALVDAAEVERAHKLTYGEIADLINSFVCENIAYDADFVAKINKAGNLPYFPDPEQTLLTRQGICVDIATLSAVMLKSLGVPTRLHFGDISQPALNPKFEGETSTKYHAWISVYLDGKWVMYDPSYNSPRIENNRIDSDVQAIEYLVETSNVH